MVKNTQAKAKAKPAKASTTRKVVKRKRVLDSDGSEHEIEEVKTVKKARVVGGVRKQEAKGGKAKKPVEKRAGKGKAVVKTKGKVVRVDDSDEDDVEVLEDDDNQDEGLQEKRGSPGDEDEDDDGVGDENEDGDGDDGDGAEDGDGEDGDVDDGDDESSDNGEIRLPKRGKRKKDSTRDLRLMFALPRETVVFVEDDGHEEEETGAYCFICRDDKQLKKLKKARAGFFRGANSSLRRHIASEHYETYAKLCQEHGIPENHCAIPDDVKAEREAKEKAAAKKKGGQTTLDSVVKKVETPTAFSPEAILQAVTEHVVCGDQALAVADDITFRNCLVTMRPKTKTSELPSRTTIRSHISNEFITYMETLQEDIKAAPGKVSTLCDTWTAPNTSEPFMGLMTLWIQVRDNGVWVMRDEVAAFHNILGAHTGANLGRYIMLFLDRCGVTSKTHSKLGHMTNDNASNNYSSAKAIAKRLNHRGIADDWTALDRNLSCYGHVVQLGVEDFMSVITQKAIAETKQAIWDYDPTSEDSLVGGGLDVISILRTLAVKIAHIQASGQRKQLFHKIQLEEEEDLKKPLNLVLHTKTRWMSAGKMCSRTYRLKKTIRAFVAVADIRFGPITTLRPKNGRAKKIPWTAFQLDDDDWERVNLCAKILEDADGYHQLCSTTRAPTLHQVIPALERLVTKWEKKAQDPKYALFHDALKAGIAKLNKYYKKLDNSDAYILSLLLHPYYKLDYIRHEWGGQEEYEAALEAGDPDARNWVAYAREVVEKAMCKYWPLRFGRMKPKHAPAPVQMPSPSGSGSDSDENKYAKARQALLRRGEPDDGWKVELESYLKDPAADVTKDSDTVLYWQRAHKMWPTLGRMALDILPIAAASVGIESLFSRAKEVSTDRRSSLDPELFEQIECLKYHWTPKLTNLARINQTRIEEIDMRDFENLLKADGIITAAFENDPDIVDDSE